MKKRRMQHRWDVIYDFGLKDVKMLGKINTEVIDRTGQQCASSSLLAGLNSLFHSPGIVFRNVVIDLVSRVLMEKLRVVIAHDSVSIGLRLIGWSACRCGPRRGTGAAGGGSGRVRHPGEFDVTDAWDVCSPTKQLFGKVSLLEGDHDGVWPFWVAINALIVADSLCSG
jgi:hypothetical protein